MSTAHLHSHWRKCWILLRYNNCFWKTEIVLNYISPISVSQVSLKPVFIQVNLTIWTKVYVLDILRHVNKCLKLWSILNDIYIRKWYNNPKHMCIYIKTIPTISMLYFYCWMYRRTSNQSNCQILQQNVIYFTLLFFFL